MNKIDRAEYWADRGRKQGKSIGQKSMIVSMVRTGSTYRQIELICSDAGLAFSYEEFVVLCDDLGVTPVMG